MEDLVAENKRLQRALDMRKVEKKQKELLKAKKIMEHLRLKVKLQEAEADNKELRGAAKQVRLLFTTKPLIGETTAMAVAASVYRDCGCLLKTACFVTVHFEKNPKSSSIASDALPVMDATAVASGCL